MTDSVDDPMLDLTPSTSMLDLTPSTLTPSTYDPVDIMTPSTTMIYTHVLNQGAQGVPSPLNDLI